jgi:hypothetical protein
MQLSSGGRFWPLDPRQEDIHIEDIANGLALDCRYAGQCKIDSFYSVAEQIRSGLPRRSSTCSPSPCYSTTGPKPTSTTCRGL